jgi:hypothetical protein
LIRLTRSIALARLGAERQFVALRQPGFRAYVMRLRGMNYDAVDRANAKRANFRNDLTVVLEGEWVDRRDGEQVLHAGEAACGAASVAADRWKDGVLLLTLEWDEPVVEGWTRKALGAGTLTAARAFVGAISDEQKRGGDQPSLEALLSALRGEGFAVPGVTPLEPPEQAVRAAQMLNLALTNLSRAPMWVDFTSERSERQWRRDLTQARAWIGLLGGSFRSTLNTIRLSFAVSLLGAPGATMSEIASALGYRNERTLIQALNRAGLAPAEVRRRGQA